MAIADARNGEARTHQFEQWLRHKISSLHPAVQFEGTDPQRDLAAYLTEYVDLVPQMLQQISLCAEQGRVLTTFQRLIDRCAEYFVSPSGVPVTHPTLQSLVIPAYQSHRLIEEFHDNNRSLAHAPAGSMHATRINLLVHDIIGEPFANEVDQACLLSFREMVVMEDYLELDLHAYRQAWESPAAAAFNRHWQSLMERHHIRLGMRLRLH